MMSFPLHNLLDVVPPPAPLEGVSPVSGLLIAAIALAAVVAAVLLIVRSRKTKR